MGRKKTGITVYTGKVINGRWTEQENMTYLKFLLENSYVFEEPGMRKRKAIFLKMAERLGTRSPDQCRSHHQKVEKYANTKQIDGIAEFLLKQKINEFSPDKEEIRERLNKLIDSLGSD